jgi:hypothetical protein
MPLDPQLLTEVRGSAGEHGNIAAAMRAVHNNLPASSIRGPRLGSEANHAETQILQGSGDWMQGALTGAGGRLDELHFFTYRSPCQNCTAMLVDFRRHYGAVVATWRLGWADEWIPSALLTERTTRTQALTAAQAALGRATADLAPPQADFDAAVATLQQLQAALAKPGLTLEGQNRIQAAITRAQADRSARSLALAHARAAVRVATDLVNAAAANLATTQAAITAHVAQQAANRTALATGGWTVTQE